MQRIRKKISAWYTKNKRELPWRNSTDPYVIWLSEIIMQQTRIEQGTPYFLRFLKRYPDVFAFAAASEHDILKLWQGLGYYSRGRNMHETAKIIVNDFNGKFPDNYKQMIQLKGIGDYTASLILSVCFDLPLAVVDGNVHRVLSRLYGMKESHQTSSGKNIFKNTAYDLLDKKKPGDFNQAMMDLGAMICTPQNPQCEDCPLTNNCYAFQNDKQDQLPVKNIKIELKKRYFHYLFISDGEKFFLRKRVENDIWKGLYDLPLIETHTTLKLTKKKIQTFLHTENIDIKFSRSTKHLLSHQQLVISFYEIKILKNEFISDSKYISVSKRKFNQYAVPKPIERFLQEGGIS